MKNILYKLVFTVALVSQSFAAEKVGLAIKLDLTDKARQIIKVKLVEEAGNLHRAADSNQILRTPHVSVGYIEGLANRQQATHAGSVAKTFIDQYLTTNPINFVVYDCRVKFGSFTVLEPDQNTANALKQLNLALEQHLNSQGYNLNSLTTNAAYQPHITLKRNSSDSNQLVSINTMINNLKSEHPSGVLFFMLQSASFSTSASFIRKVELEKETKQDNSLIIKTSHVPSSNIRSDITNIFNYLKTNYPHMAYASLTKDKEEQLIDIAAQLVSEAKTKKDSSAIAKAYAILIRPDIVYIFNYVKGRYTQSVYASLTHDKEEQLIDIAAQLVSEGKTKKDSSAITKAYEILNTNS